MHKSFKNLVCDQLYVINYKYMQKLKKKNLFLILISIVHICKMKVTSKFVNKCLDCMCNIFISCTFIIKIRIKEGK